MSEPEQIGAEVERVQSQVLAHREPTVDDLVKRSELIQEAMRRAMRDGEHYGVIPGTQKPTLLKPGAEKLCQLFTLDPEYDTEETWDENGHYTVKATCTLYHIPTGNRVASGVGLCTTKEEKYAYRIAMLTCPHCGEAAVIKGKEEYGGGWVCFRKKGGCGAKFADGDASIETQPTGKVDNPYLPDTYNTVLKIACKRALVTGVLNATAASDVFTQDMEDHVQVEPVVEFVHTAEVHARLEAELTLNHYSDIWHEENILDAASRQFGRQITSIDQLSDPEMEQIIQGAQRWRDINPPPPVEAEFAVDESDFQPPA